MKKNICGFFVLMVFALFMSCCGTMAAEEAASDDVKVEAVQNKPLSKKEIKNQKRKELKERQKAQREELKQAQKKEKEEFKLAQKKEKEEIKQAKIKQKEELKQAKKQARENLKQAKEDLKQEKIKQKEELKQAKIATKQQAMQMEEIEEKAKEAKKIQKKDVEDIFGETALVSYGNEKANDKKANQIEAANVTPVNNKKTKDDGIKKAATKTSDTKSSDDKLINIEKAEKELEESVNTLGKNIGEENSEASKTADNKNEYNKQPAVYKRTYTYADIDKNAVSINDFLQFTEEQNEKFSVFYYKTTTKLDGYNKSINAKEEERKIVEANNLSEEEKLTKIKKLKKETDDLYYERDKFYNDSLDKFNSILNKRQRTKWEILQEMGYRFLPEID